MSWTIKQGDLEPAYSVQLLVDGVPPTTSLVGLTVTFLLTNIETNEPEVNAPAIIDDPDQWKVSYHWQPGDTDALGTYRAEWIVAESGRPRTFPQRGYQYIKIEAR